MADRYWVGGSGTWDSSSTANWSATSGGAPGASAPTSADNVFFNAVATYTVTADFGVCRNITVTNGPVTFNSPTSDRIFQAWGNTVNIAANTQFTCPANTSLNIDWTPTVAGAATCTFNSSGTNTQKVYMTGGTLFAGGLVTSVTWCTANTQTFAGVGLLLPDTTFTCAGSTITIDYPDRVSGNQVDNFSLDQQTSLSMAATTINFGSATPTGANPLASFNIATYSTTEPSTTTLNVIAVRTDYFYTQIGVGWFDTSTFQVKPGRLGNITIRGSGLIGGASASISNIYGCSALTVIGCNCQFNANNNSLAKTFSGAVLITASNLNVDDSLSVTFSSTTTLNSSGGSVPSLFLTSNATRTITFTGAFSATGIATNNPAGLYWPNSGTIIFSSTFTSTFSDFQSFASGNSPTDITFTGAVSITNPSTISDHTVAATNTVTISNALSITATISADGLSQNLGFLGQTLTTSSTVTNWTFTNARPIFNFGVSQTIANPVLLVNGGGLYFSNNLTLTSALSSSGATSYNILAALGYNETLTLNSSVTLVNCQLASKYITVLGGATRNFSYSLSATPVVSNITNTLNYNTPWGDPKSASYPEICVDVFTLSNTGGTFSITGGGSAIYRTFVRPYDLTSLSFNGAFGFPVITPTLTDVDFWRFQSNNPISGTRLGRVGTTALTNITTAAPKTVYWVGGAGAWDAAKWATSSGGAGSALNYPLPQDTIIFDANSGTGDFTYPASVRIGSLDVQNVPAGTSAVYCNAATIVSNNAPAYLWVSKDINGPAGIPVGTFVLGNTSINTYDSFSTNFIAQSLIVADSSALDTHTITPTNITFMPYGSLQFASIGTTDIQSSLTEPLYAVRNFSSGNYTINITAAQIGSSSYNYSNSNASFALGTNDLAINSVGAVNYGSCSIYADEIYLDFNAPNTAYSVYVARLQCGILGINGCTAIGNVNFTQGNSSTTNYQLTVCKPISLLNLNIVSKSNFTGTTLRVSHFGISPRTISMYSLTVTYSGFGTAMGISQQSGSKPTFVKLGGGNVSVLGVNVTSIDASPANTWYTTGTRINATGWDAGPGPNSKGGFLLF